MNEEQLKSLVATVVKVVKLAQEKLLVSDAHPVVVELARQVAAAKLNEFRKG